MRFGSYEILQRLGEGGMGEVYRARDTRLGRDIALKTLSLSRSSHPDAASRLQQEARSACALNHPNIVTIYELGHINGTDYIEFYVGNAKQASHYYRAAFGFKLVAYRGPETGTRDRASYVMQQGKIRFVLTTPTGPEGEVARHVHDHGDGVKDLALW